MKAITCWVVLILMLALFYYNGIDDISPDRTSELNKWEIPHVGNKYIHYYYEEIVLETPKLIKYRIELETSVVPSHQWKNKSAFITVKNGVVVSVWIGHRGL